MIIAVDFDGTIVEHAYPKMGFPVPLALPVLHKLQKLGHKLILNTMRCGVELTRAVEYCREFNIEFWAVNENPEQSSWTESPKLYANLYIDDAAVGCPLIYPPGGRRPYVDWTEVVKHLSERVGNWTSQDTMDLIGEARFGEQR